MPEQDSSSNHFRFAASLRDTLREGYHSKDAWRDVQAGLVTALVALPLAMALGIASGVPPQHGLFTVIVAGAIAASCGGSRTLVTGPTAAFVVLLLPITLKFGLGGLATAGLLAGLMLVAMGLLGLGRAVEYVPMPVTIGFTSGVGLVIASLQLKDFMGLDLGAPQEHFLGRLGAIGHSLGTVQPLELAVGAATLAIIIVIGRVNRRLPGPVLALTAVTAAVALLHLLRPDLGVATIGTRFQYSDASGPHPGFARGFAGIHWPWNWQLPNQPTFTLSVDSLRAILPSAVAIALLGAIESLLAAAVADGMASQHHDPDSELVGQGLGNLVAPFFGGIPATGAIARTAAAIRYGARSPFAALTHSLTVLCIVLALAPLAAWLPMAGLAALLLVVAWNMAEAKHFLGILRVGRWGDRMVLLTCFGFTVLFDMTVGVTAGIILAALFLIRRLDELGESRLLETGDALLPKGTRLAPGTRVFQVTGTLLFGAAGKTLLPLARYDPAFTSLILDLSPVRSMDISGLAALEEVVRELRKKGTRVHLSASSASALELLSRSEYFSDPEQGPPVYGSLAAALKVESVAQRPPRPVRPPKKARRRA
jgi:SulP family sulfate permease